MNLVKVKFLDTSNKPNGRAYTYGLPDGLEVKVGDIVIPKASAKGVITEVNVPVETITFSLDKLQTILGLAEQKPELKILICCPEGKFEDTVSKINKLHFAEKYDICCEFDGTFYNSYDFKVYSVWNGFKVSLMNEIREALISEFTVPGYGDPRIYISDKKIITHDAYGSFNGCV